MDHGIAIMNLLELGYSFELARDERRVIRLADDGGDILDAPTLPEMVQLVMGMTIQDIKDLRDSPEPTAIN